MRGLLLRIGIDRGRGTGGCLGPIFSDNSFEYIPILESRATSEMRTYRDLIGSSGKPFTDFVPKRLYNSIPHIDPEFETYSYGDPTFIKRRQLVRLSQGDLLIFYAGLKSTEGKGEARLYIIGYFTIKNIYDFNKIPASKRAFIFNNIPNNAHSKRKCFDEGLVIVRGDPNKSRLLSCAALLGNKNSKLLYGLRSTFGYSRSLLRAVGHWIDDPYIQKVRNWLREYQ